MSLDNIYNFEYFYTFFDFFDIINILLLSKKFNIFLKNNKFIENIIKEDIYYDQDGDQLNFKYYDQNKKNKDIGIYINTKKSFWCFTCNNNNCKANNFHDKQNHLCYYGFNKFLELRFFDDENQFVNIKIIKLIFYKLKKNFNKIREMDLISLIKYMLSIYILYLNNLSISCKLDIEEYLDNYHYDSRHNKIFSIDYIKNNKLLFSDIIIHIITHEKDINTPIYFYIYECIDKWCNSYNCEYDQHFNLTL